MAYTTIKKPSLYFNTNLHTGTGSSQNITTGLNMSANGGMVWNKLRSGTNNHIIWDTIRTATKSIYPDLTAAEATEANSLTAFTTTGWTGGGSGNTNANGSTYVSWNWLAGSSHSGSSNSDGSITSTVSANTTSGFSIVKYTGTGATATVGHGLGAIPAMMIIKRYSDAGEQWTIYHKSLGNTKHILFTTGDSTTQTNYWNDTSPTNAVWTMGNQSEINGSGATNICYAFAEKTGYSKFGSYTGNGSTDGTFVYTGFKPSFVMFKRATTSGGSWCMIDTVRQPYNPNTLEFPAANLDAAEATGNYQKDFLSNGFKMRSATDNFNKSGDTYIYMAFAEEPLVGDNPATAR